MAGMQRSAMASLLLAVQGEIQCEWGAGEEARRLAEEGAALCEAGGHIGLLGWSYLALARVLAAANDLPGLERLLQKFAHLAQPAQAPPWIVSPIAAVQGLLLLAHNGLPAAEQWAGERGLQPGGVLSIGREYEWLAYARILLAQERYPQALQLLDALLAATQAGSRLARGLEIRLLQAQALEAQGEGPQAVAALQAALRLGQPAGCLQSFLDEGPGLLPLLRSLPAGEEFGAYLPRLLAAFEARFPAAAPAQQPGLIDPLSERELEVLALIAQGCQNKEIAGRLSISLNTVLFHTKHIFNKLHVSSRTQAAARARELGLF